MWGVYLLEPRARLLTIFDVLCRMPAVRWHSFQWLLDELIEVRACKMHWGSPRAPHLMSSSESRCILTVLCSAARRSWRRLSWASVSSWASCLVLSSREACVPRPLVVSPS